MRSKAWVATERDSHHHKPRYFSFCSDGPALHPSEGQGRAQMSYLLRTSDLWWEVLTASHHKEWVRMVTEIPLADLDEGVWVSNLVLHWREKDKKHTLQ